MPRVVYEFVQTGVEEVKRGFRSIREEAARARQAGGPIAGGGGKGGTSPAAGPSPYVKAQVDAWKKAQEQGAKSAAKAQVRAYEEAEKAAQKSAAAREAAAKKAAQAEIRAAEDYQKRLAKIDRDMEKRHERQQEQQRRAQARDRGRGMSQPGESMSSAVALGMMTANFASGLANRAVDVITSAAREGIALQENTRRLSVNARQAGQDFVDPSALRKDFQKAALMNPGQTAMAISEAMQSFVSLTGNLETGRQSAGTFATVASATGAQVGDVSQAAASIFNQFGLQTKEEMQDVLASLTFQGKTGAFELRDAASQFQRLAAAGASFGLTGAKGVKTIGGLAQIARTGTGSAEQTTTAIENIFSNLIAKSDILKQQGVNVFDKSGKTRDVTEVLMESIVKSGGSDFEKKGQVLQKVFGDQGIRGVRPLLAKYQAEFQGVRNRGGSEEEAAAAGLKRLREEIDKSVNAPGAWDEVQKDAAEAQKDASAQMAYQWERVKAIVADNVIPTFEKVSPKIIKALFGDGDEMGPLLKGVEALAEAASLGGEAIGEFVDSLYATGILERKPKTPAQEKAEAEKRKVKAEKALAKFDEDTQGLYKPGSDQFGPIDPNKAKEREALAQGIVNAEASVKSAEERMWTKPGQKTVDLTSDEFVRKYMDLGQQGGDAGDWKGQAAYDARVRKMAAKIEEDPTYQVAGSWKDMDSGDANDAQKALIRDYQLQQIQGKNAQPEDTSGVNELNDAAKNAAAALNKISNAGQPTIMGAPPG